MSKSTPAKYSAPQELASVANDPSTSNTWQNWGFSLLLDSDPRPPALPAGVLPEVGLQDFRGYLQAVGQRIEDFERDKATATSMTANMLLPEEMQAKQGQGLSQAMKEVPATFFQVPFDLDDPALWGSIMDSKSIPFEKKGVEKLSQYLDAVEVHLVQEIAARYDSFFDASGQVQQLKSTISVLCDKVSGMRMQTLQLEQEAAVDLKRLMSSSQQRKNVQDTLHLLQAMESVVQAEAALEAVLPPNSMSADYAGAMDVIELLRTLLTNKEIRGLTCFQGLPSHIESTATSIKEIMVTEFLEKTRAQVNEQRFSEIVQAACSPSASNGSGSEQSISVFDITPAGDLPLEEGLYPLIVGLHRLNEIVPAYEALQNASCQQYKEFVSDLTQYCCDALVDKPNRDSLCLTDAKLSDFAGVLKSILCGIGSYMAYADSLGNTITKLLDKLPDGGGIDIRKLHDGYLQALATVTANQWSKLLVSYIPGSNAGGSARLDEMQQVLTLTDQLATLLEQHCTRSVHGLRTAVQQFCRAGLDAMHNESMRSLTAALEAEQWSTTPARLHSQEFVTELRRRASAETHHLSKPEDDGRLSIGSQRFHIVKALELLLSILQSYLSFRDAVPAFTAEVAQRIIELVKVFNSRTCQLVLGAGAMQIAGLKSITAKHLALSCQSIGALVALLPSMQSVFLENAPQSRKAMLASDFARAMADLNIHCEEVCNKLVSIMHDRLAANVKQLPTIAASWSDGSQLNSSVASSFASANVKQLKILSSVLLPLLLPSDVENIFGRISELYSSILADGYGQLEPLGRTWEMQVSTDIGYILDSLKELPVSPAILQHTLQTLSKLYTLYKLPETNLKLPTAPGSIQPLAPESMVYNEAVDVETAEYFEATQQEGKQEEPQPPDTAPSAEIKGQQPCVDPLNSAQINSQ